MNHPQAEAVITIISETGERVAMIKDRKVYGLTELNDDKIAELFNGNDTLPLVQGALAGGVVDMEV